MLKRGAEKDQNLFDYQIHKPGFIYGLKITCRKAKRGAKEGHTKTQTEGPGHTSKNSQKFDVWIFRFGKEQRAQSVVWGEPGVQIGLEYGLL